MNHDDFIVDFGMAIGGGIAFGLWQHSAFAGSFAMLCLAIWLVKE